MKKRHIEEKMIAKQESKNSVGKEQTWSDAAEEVQAQLDEGAEIDETAAEEMRQHAGG